MIRRAFKINELKFFALKLGLRVLICDTESKFAQQTIYVGIRQSDLIHHPAQASLKFAKELAHELGHFLVAPKGRRYKNDYGISLKKWDGNRDNWHLDETKTILVQNKLLDYFGLNIHQRMSSDQKINKKAKDWWEIQGKDYINDLLKRQEKTKPIFGSCKL